MIYVLLFLALTDGEMRFYQVGGTYSNRVDCDKERMKASALLRPSSGLYCVEVNRN